MMLRRALQAPVALLASLPFLAGCQSADPAKKVADAPYLVGQLVHHGQFVEAVERARAFRQANPDHPEAANTEIRATVALLLEKARRRSLADQDEAALEELAAAEALDPGNPSVAMWVDKTRQKLAQRWYELAREAHAESDLEAAAYGYRQALVYEPDHTLAKNDLEIVTVQQDHRVVLSDDYYNEGVRSLAEYELQLAKSRFKYSQTYNEEGTRATRRINEVDRELAKQREAIAQHLVADGYYAAAVREYQNVIALDPSHTVAAQQLAELEIEAEAANHLRDGKMWILRGEFDKALESLQAGRALTKRQGKALDEAIASIDDARVAAMYQLALDLEHDFRYPLAIEKYGEILAERDFYESARARMGTLQDYVRNAAALYQEAVDSDDDAARLQKLREIAVFWPEYRDVPDWIMRLEASAQASASATNG